MISIDQNRYGHRCTIIIIIIMKMKKVASGKFLFVFVSI